VFMTTSPSEETSDRSISREIATRIAVTHCHPL
jgi:hypothetical protein